MNVDGDDSAGAAAGAAAGEAGDHPEDKFTDKKQTTRNISYFLPFQELVLQSLQV